MYELPISIKSTVEAPPQLIPRTIYQTFKTNKVSANMFYAVQTWLQFNPEYSYEFYDDQRQEEYVRNFDCEGLNFTNEELNKAYDSIKIPAGKADIWRYLIIYKNGGVYVDIDTICQVPLSQYVNPDDTIVTGITGWLYGNKINPNARETGRLILKWYHLFYQCYLIYTPQNPFIKTTLEACIQAVNTRTPIPGSENCENLLERYTGPCVLNYTVRKYLGLSKDEDLKKVKDTILILEDINQKIHLVGVLEKIKTKYPGYDADLFKNSLKYWQNDPDIFTDEESTNMFWR
jgi:mannosyltransferase OCH1-like enzyme